MTGRGDWEIEGRGSWEPGSREPPSSPHLEKPSLFQEVQLPHGTSKTPPDV